MALLRVMALGVSAALVVVITTSSGVNAFFNPWVVLVIILCMIARAVSSR